MQSYSKKTIKANNIITKIIPFDYMMIIIRFYLAVSKINTTFAAIF